MIWHNMNVIERKLSHYTAIYNTSTVTLWDTKAFIILNLHLTDHQNSFACCFKNLSYILFLHANLSAATVNLRIIISTILYYSLYTILFNCLVQNTDSFRRKKMSLLWSFHIFTGVSKLVK